MSLFVGFGNQQFNMDTGWKSPTGNGAKWNNWTDPEKAYSSNEEWATFESVDEVAGRQSYETFGFGEGYRFL